MPRRRHTGQAPSPALGWRGAVGPLVQLHRLKPSPRWLIRHRGSGCGGSFLSTRKRLWESAVVVPRVPRGATSGLGGGGVGVREDWWAWRLLRGL